MPDSASCVRVLACACAALLATACAHVHVDAQGRTHVVGLVWLTLPEAEAPAGQALRMRALGLSLTRSEVASSMVLGYHDTTLAFLHNHSLLDVSALWSERDAAAAGAP